MLKLDNLVKQYPTGDRALKGVDLEVPEGQVMALIGPSGAGKSTLIRCVNRLVEPTSGHVYLADGEEITGLGAWGLRKARRRMGMIFQEYALVERLSVMENVLSGRYPLGRMLYVYVDKDPNEELPPMVSEFLKYMLSQEGQRVVVKDGYLPLTPALAARELAKF